MLPIDNLIKAKNVLRYAEEAERSNDLKQAYMDACEAVLYIEAWQRQIREALRGEQ